MVITVISTERISERVVAQAGDQTVPHVAAETLEVIKATPTERSFECVVEQSVDLPVPQVVQNAPQKRKKKPEIPLTVSATDLDDFVTLLVDKDVHISSDVMWDAIDMVAFRPNTTGASRPHSRLAAQEKVDRAQDALHTTKTYKAEVGNQVQKLREQVARDQGTTQQAPDDMAALVHLTDQLTAQIRLDQLPQAAGPPLPSSTRTATRSPSISSDFTVSGSRKQSMGIDDGGGARHQRTNGTR